MSKRIVFDLFKYMLAFGLLAWVISGYWNPPGGNGLAAVWQRHVLEGQPVNWGYLATGLCIFCLAVGITLFRWYVLVRAVGLSLNPVEAVRIGLIGFFYSIFLPGSVGGDLVKAVALSRTQSRRTVAVATVVMDRVIALWGLMWFVAILGGVFWWLGYLDGASAGQARTVVSAAAVIVAVSSLVWVLLGQLSSARSERFAERLSALPRAGGPAGEFWRAAWMYRCRPGSVALAMGLSWLNFAGLVYGFYCCARSLYNGDPPGAVPGLVEHFLIVPVGLVIMSVPLFPGGLGIGEAGFGGLYRWFGFLNTFGVLGLLVYRVLFWVVAVAGFGLACCLPRPAGKAGLDAPAVTPEPTLPLPGQSAAAG